MCENSFNPCELLNGSSVCQNGAFCSVNLACFPYYQCICSDGYYGNNCQYLSTTIITTTVPTTTVYSTCYDSDTVACAYYARNLLCSNFFQLNNVAIPDYCPKSCGVCTPTNVCQDSQSSCIVWKVFNLCSRLNEISPHPCPKSCNLCVQSKRIILS